ncbi:MAG: 1-acyl-sn-glycerol-3-phosphate acyltransferase [Bacteroidales bacterium]|nr:1-acyl-sn-glycerol-3-phosphate acyltransferase [Bacteroidales bacterium]
MNFSERLLNLFGWKAVVKLDGEIPKKAVVLTVPHTSYWDFFIGFFTYKALGLKAHYLIKQEAFFFPLGYIIKSIGGIPVRRGKNNVVKDVVKEMNNHENFLLTIAPEGKRTAQKTWKTGYHRIAKAANVPVLVGFVDYKSKTCGFAATYNVTDNFEKDTIELMKNYIGMEGKIKDGFYLPPEVFKK